MLLLIILVTAASIEVFFFKVKLIKFFLSYYVGQHRLCNLVILYNEHFLSRTLDFEELI